MDVDEAHGKRALRIDKELGRWMKSMDGMTEEDENVSMGIVRVAAGVSGIGYEVSRSLPASNCTDVELSCADRWGSMY